jgi:hypothetical protein
MKIRLSLLFIVLALFAGVHQIAAQGTAFTYQGLLNNAGGAANGTYDLTFKLWSASSGGSQVGSTLTVSGVGVTNGLFTEILDFGGVFNGSSYWLELGVRTNGAASFSTLAPRQELTPTPYAITAENVDGLVPAAQLSGILPTTLLNGLYNSIVNLSNPGNTINGSFVGSGTGLTGVALLAGGNNFTGNQTVNGTVQVNGPEQITGASGVGFHTDENIGPNTYFTGEEHGINFNYGTGSAQNIGSLIMGYNGQGYFSVGNLYNSTGQSGTKAFTVFGDGDVNVDPQDLNAGAINSGNTNSSGLTFGAGSGEGIASQRTAGIDQFSLDFYTAFVNRMTIIQSGLVGIGTTNPAAQLDVESAASIGIQGATASTVSSAYAVYGLVSSTSPGGDSTGVRGQNNGTGGLGIGVWGSQNGSGWGGYFTSASGIGALVSGGTGTGISVSGATGISVSGTGSALTINSGAIHVTGASTNSTTTAAFTQVTSAANIAGNESIINNTLCNGDPNAILIITHNDNPQGTFHGETTHAVGVFYTGSAWTIYNEDNTAMSPGLAFNVLIIKN